MNFEARLREARRASADSDTIAELAREALAEGEEEPAIPLVLAAAEKLREARLWQWAGLLNRAIDDHANALQCFTTAARHEPTDPKIAHGLAHVALEAGVDAVALFKRARYLAPADPAVLVGMSAARMAAGQSEAALIELENVLDAAPLWVAGHLQLAQLGSLLGDASRGPASLEQAISSHPRERSLWNALCDLHLRREEHERLLDTVERAERAAGPGDDLGYYRAVAAVELRDQRAEQLLSDEAAMADPRLAIWRIRYLLSQGQAGAALPLIDRELDSDRKNAIWPYAGVVWRMTGDRRSGWLEDQPNQVRVLDIASELSLIDIADRLHSLHQRSGQFMDQSVRGGSQTDGPLLSRIDPQIQQVRRAIVRAVEQYVAELPPRDLAHPLLGPPRDRSIRLSGSWSVLLSAGGQHANHVHPQGWISSALYIALPQKQSDEAPKSGWLVLGEPPARLGVDLPARLQIEPKQGQLVLFPSWMWHGTRPFAQGERLTVAFDVARPFSRER